MLKQYRDRHQKRLLLLLNKLMHRLTRENMRWSALCFSINHLTKDCLQVCTEETIDWLHQSRRRMPCFWWDRYTYLGSNISAIESNLNIRIVKAWNAIDRLSIILKFDLSDRIKAVVVSVLLYRCTTWTPTKCVEKKQHSTKQLLYVHLACILRTIQSWRTNHAGQCRRNKNELLTMFSYELLNMNTPVLANQERFTTTALYGHWIQSRGLAGIDGKKESRHSVLSALYDNEGRTCVSVWENASLGKVINVSLFPKEVKNETMPIIDVNVNRGKWTFLITLVVCRHWLADLSTAPGGQGRRADGKKSEKLRTKQDQVGHRWCWADEYSGLSREQATFVIDAVKAASPSHQIYRMHATMYITIRLESDLCAEFNQTKLLDC